MNKRKAKYGAIGASGGTKTQALLPGGKGKFGGK